MNKELPDSRSTLKVILLRQRMGEDGPKDKDKIEVAIKGETVSVTITPKDFKKGDKKLTAAFDIIDFSAFVMGCSALVDNMVSNREEMDE